MNEEIEKTIPDYLLEIGESFDQKYQPVLDFEGWRVAMLRHNDATDRNLFKRIERHNETCEVFILTEGEADLIIAENGAVPVEFYVIPMRKNVAYNIKPGVWHHVVMSKQAHIILFEKSDTSCDNSNYHLPDETVITGLKMKLRYL